MPHALQWANAKATTKMITYAIGHNLNSSRNAGCSSTIPFTKIDATSARASGFEAVDACFRRLIYALVPLNPQVMTQVEQSLLKRYRVRLESAPTIIKDDLEKD